MRRRFGLMLAVLMMASSVVGPAAGQTADPAVTDRIEVSQPVAGAVQISQQRFPTSAAHVVLATTADFADSLTAAPLTADGPLLLTDPGQLLPDVAAEIERLLDPGGLVYLLGGTAALDGSVGDDLSERGLEVRRLAGDTRITTGIAVAREVAQRYGTGATVAVARAFGEGSAAWADSVTGGGWAAEQQMPLLLTPTESLDGDVAELLQELGTEQAIVLGGAAAIGDTTADALPAARRVAGGERSATAAAVAEQLWGATPGYLVINGYRDDGWALGLPAAGMAADRGHPLLVADVDRVPGPTLDRLGLGCESGPPQILTTVIGSEDILSDAVIAAIDQHDGGTCPASPIMIDGSGLGVTDLGAPGPEAVAAITQVLGEPSFVSEEFFPFCESSASGRGRTYTWGDSLSVFIIDPDEDTFGNPGTGETQFWGAIYGGFTYDRDSDTFVPRPDPYGLTTDVGIGLGSTGADVQAAYGSAATFHPGFEDEFPPPTWELPGDLFAFADTNDTQTNRIETFQIGRACGE